MQVSAWDNVCALPVQNLLARLLLVLVISVANVVAAPTMVPTHADACSYYTELVQDYVELTQATSAQMASACYEPTPLPTPSPTTFTAISTWTELNGCVTAALSLCKVVSNITFTSTISINGQTTTIMSDNSAALDRAGTGRLFYISGSSQVYRSVCTFCGSKAGFISLFFSGHLFRGHTQEWQFWDWGLRLHYRL